MAQIIQGREVYAERRRRRSKPRRRSKSLRQNCL